MGCKFSVDLVVERGLVERSLVERNLLSFVWWARSEAGNYANAEIKYTYHVSPVVVSLYAIHMRGSVFLVELSWYGSGVYRSGSSLQLFSLVS